MTRTNIFKSLVLIAGLSSSVFAEQVVKFATLAPEGSTWVNVFKALDEDVKAKTQGRVRFRIYPGGVSGDEKDVLRKIRLGQLQAAGFTGVGLGEVLPEVRVLDTPFLFASGADVDRVEKNLFPYFAEAFDKKGFVLLGWADVGFVYFFSKSPVGSIEDLGRAKAWTWEGDPVAQELYAAAHVSPIPLSVPDVLTSLQTGLIDTVYASPLAAVALQWFTKVKIMMDLPMTHATGAVLVSKKFFLTLSPQDQAAVKELSRKRLDELNRLSRQEQEKAKDALRAQGLAFQTPGVAQTKAFAALGIEVQKKLVGRLYSQKLLDDVKKSLTARR